MKILIFVNGVATIRKYWSSSKKGRGNRVGERGIEIVNSIIARAAGASSHNIRGVECDPAQSCLSKKIRSHEDFIPVL